jgi:hypothetical protein
MARHCTLIPTLTGWRGVSWAAWEIFCQPYASIVRVHITCKMELASSEKKVMSNMCGSPFTFAVDHSQYWCLSQSGANNCWITCALYGNSCSVLTALWQLLYDIPACESFHSDLSGLALSLSLTSAKRVYVATVDQWTCFGRFTFPVFLNCFTNFHITDFAGVGHLDQWLLSLCIALNNSVLR